MSGKKRSFSVVDAGGGGAGERVKRSRKVISLEVKLDVLQRLDAGQKIKTISTALGLATSTVGTIKESRAKIVASAQAATPATAARLFFHRSNAMVHMEQLLSVWIEDQTRRNAQLSATAIQKKAHGLYLAVLDNVADETDPRKPFAASKGWFERFKRRQGFQGLGSSADYFTSEAANAFPGELRRLIEEGGYSEKQVFNVCETSLFWKRLPEPTSISREETSTGLRDSRDRLTVLLGGNAAGDFKVKPLLVYHTDTLEDEDKSKLSVEWRTQEKCWVTADTFQAWFTDTFCPGVEKYCAEENLPNRALLILDNSASHPVELGDISDNVRVVFMPRSASISLQQPMDRGVISSFKSRYLRRTFSQLHQHVMQGGEDERTARIREFWEGYDIMDGVASVAKSWDEVGPAVINAAWKPVFSDAVADGDNLSPLSQDLAKTRLEIVTLAKAMGFEEVEEDDVAALTLQHFDSDELSNEDLVLMLEQERGSASVLAAQHQQGEEASWILSGDDPIAADDEEEEEEEPMLLEPDLEDVKNMIMCKEEEPEANYQSEGDDDPGEEGEREEDDGERTVSAPPRQLTLQQMSRGFTLLDECLQIFVGNDSNRDRSRKVSRLVNDAFSCYRDLYKEKMRESRRLLKMEAD